MAQGAHEEGVGNGTTASQVGMENANGYPNYPISVSTKTCNLNIRSRIYLYMYTKWIYPNLVFSVFLYPILDPYSTISDSIRVSVL